MPTITIFFPVCFWQEDFEDLYRLTTKFLSILTPALLSRIPPRCNRRPWAMEWRWRTSCQGYGCKLLRMQAFASNHLIIYPGARSTELDKRRGLPWSWVLLRAVMSLVLQWPLLSTGTEEVCLPCLQIISFTNHILEICTSTLKLKGTGPWLNIWTKLLKVPILS